jgi:hypothetical protein
MAGASSLAVSAASSPIPRSVKTPGIGRQRRAHRIRDRLGWPGGVLEGGGWGKSKGMHWRSDERLCGDRDTFDDVVNRSVIARFGPMLKKRGFLSG